MPSPFLAGAEVDAAWARKERYFDAHGHFFNASDVPVKEFLRKSVAHSIESDEARNALIALAPLAETLAYLAPTPAVEMESLCRRDIKGLSFQAQSSELDDAIDAHTERVGNALFDLIATQAPEVPGLVDGAQIRASRAGGFGIAGAGKFDRDYVLRAVRNGASLPRDGQGKVRPLRSETYGAEAFASLSIQNVFQFLRFMLSPRHYNLRSFIRTFSAQSPSVPLSGCFSAMVDFNYWLDCPGKAASMRDQVLVQAQLALLSRGFLLPLVGYNPWVDIKEEDASYETVKWAIEQQGCVGVKIYPAMGFYPYGNEGHPVEGSTEKFPDGALLDQKLKRLYALCDDLGVPVMAHADHSIGRDKYHDALGGVRGWEAARTQLGHMKSLHVNVGHFGGAVPSANSANSDGSGSSGSSDWNADFVALMGRPGPLKVYGDLGYWNELIGNRQAIDHLKNALYTPLPGGEFVYDRTMYGSDWHMLSKSAGWESYADGIADVLRGFQDPAVLERVMGANVLACYGLTAATSRGNFKRLQDYYLASGLKSLPGWM